MAVLNLTNQSVLAKIAVEDKSPDVRVNAVLKLTSHPLLAKIAAQDESPRVRDAAREMLPLVGKGGK